MLELADIITWLPAFALVLMRVGGMMLSAPLFSSTTIPVRVRAILVAAIAVVVFPIVRPDMQHLPPTLLGTAVAAGAEMIIGLTVGLAVNLLFDLDCGSKSGQVRAKHINLGLDRRIPVGEEEVLNRLESFAGLAAYRHRRRGRGSGRLIANRLG